MLEEEWGVVIEHSAVFAIGIVVGTVEPLVGVAALARVGLAHIRLVTRRRATGGYGLCALAVLRVRRGAVIVSERDGALSRWPPRVRGA